jgi:hypothetical protein
MPHTVLVKSNGTPFILQSWLPHANIFAVKIFGSQNQLKAAITEQNYPH